MYVAYSGPTGLIGTFDDLERLIRVLDGVVKTYGHDLTVWQDDAKLVAVVLADGRTIRFDRPRWPNVLPFVSGRVQR